MTFAIKPNLKCGLQGNNPTWLSVLMLIYQNVCRINNIEDSLWQSQIFWGSIFHPSKAAVKDMHLKGGVQGLPKASAKQP